MIRSVRSRPLLVIAGGVFSAVFGLCVANVSAVHAEPSSLTGSWSGNGAISFASGAKEKARCRAHFAKTGASSYAMSASCATASAKIDQTATLYKTGRNSYTGNFFNQQYNTGGSIRITVSGRTQKVRLAGEAGSAFFSLRKR